MKLFGFAGFSGAGKTTLIEGVIPCLTRRGLRVALIKHAHHDFDIDHPGKDSWRHRKAGCAEVVVASRNRIALMRELPADSSSPPGLEMLTQMLAPCDLVLVEGYKHAPIPKLEVRQRDCATPVLHGADPWIVALAGDFRERCHLPVFRLGAHGSIADFICRYLALDHGDEVGPLPRAESAARGQRLQRSDS